ncbi:hypothetical protein F4775DRAFT_559326 [Biscogniauxia sp. FL1348]|nr:hypothetical protein F4775DRAFT_559326 [Biscogniauxia sp. FL1348]
MSLSQDQAPLSVAGLSLEDRARDGPSVKTRHERGKPSIDVHLAQDLVKHEKLPIVEQSQDDLETQVVLVASEGAGNPKTGATSSSSSSNPAAASRNKAIKEEPDLSGETREMPRRDSTTGRILSENGKSCLRCARKGLKCTLHFYGLDAEPRCAACRRSGAAHCVRPRNLRDQVSWRGAAWQNPNYVTGSVPPLPAAQMEAVLREQLGEDEDEPCYYLQGNYVRAADRAAMALPPFNWADAPPAGEERRSRAVDWRGVVPTTMNRSLALRTSGEFDEAQLQYLRASRHYQPRAAHVTEAFPDTW